MPPAVACGDLDQFFKGNSGTDEKTDEPVARQIGRTTWRLEASGDGQGTGRHHPAANGPLHGGRPSGRGPITREKDPSGRGLG
jgi:hypothetical protein